MLTQSDICFLHRVRHPADINVYAEMLPWPKRVVRQKVNRLKVGGSLTLYGDVVRGVTIRLRHTEHGGFTPTLAHLPQNRGVKSVEGLTE